MASTFTITLPEPPVPPDSVADLLRSSAPIGGMEFSHTIAYIDELESQIAMYDRAVASLQLRRAQLLQSIEAHKAILSPIRRLPPEIPGEIFSLVVHETFRTHVLPPVTKEAPWLLTRVCRYWSAVALATPTLWSIISVDLDRVCRGHLPLTRLCLARSGNKFLAPFCHCLIAGGLCISMYELLQQLTGVCSLSNLETLIIGIALDPPDPGRTYDPAFWNIFAATPKLTFLDGVFWDDLFCRAPFSLPWHQLTRVCTTFASNAEALSTLGKLPLIVECKFAFQIIEVLPVDSSPIHLPYLHSLVLQFETDNDDSIAPATYQNHTSLLNFLKTPCLQNLITHETADEDDVLDFITRSNCATSLTWFQFHLSSINLNLVLRMVRSMPHLASLRLEDFGGTLCPRSSLSSFVHAFSKERLAMRAEFPPRKSLHVKIVDSQLNEKDVRDFSRIVASMQQEDLFITVSSHPHRLSIISENF
ncbi:F-box domain-containing protein [Mycena sanguinolenta]|uniref:F-box domain-containing protein n=1 Tax=Mycena sanguinolenta TaxID=230812 RepID=A0A8H6YSF1_9AGAR|nr:F-box domain-containing protein [Mycena sanguinolenta]